MKNKHGTEVKVDQVWKACDYRQTRHVKVVRLVGEVEARVFVVTCAADGYASHGARELGIALRRFHPHSTGFVLIKDVEAA